MTTTTEDTETLICDLAAAFVTQPDALDVGSQPAEDGSCYFALKGAAEDDGRLIGSEGSHVAALTFLVDAFGKVAGRCFTFRLLTQGSAFRQGDYQRAKKDVLSHDPGPARELLARVLESLGIEAGGVSVGPGAGHRRSLNFVFSVRPKSDRERTLVLERRKIVLRAATSEKEERAIEMSLVEALGTLWRAAGHKAGVRYHISITSP